MNETWTRLQQTLEPYMSATAARVVLRTAVDSCQLDPERLASDDLSRLVSALIPAAHHFVTHTQREKLATQLQALLAQGKPLKPTLTTVRTEADASRVRLEARGICQEIGANGFDCQKVATAVSELARNQIAYAGGGVIELLPDRGPPRRIQVVARDQGKGIANLEEILSGRYRSKTGLGLGILGVKRLSHKFEAQTGPTGTRIQFEVLL